MPQNFKAKVPDELFEKRYKALKRFCFVHESNMRNSRLTLVNVFGEKATVGVALRDLIRRFEILRENEPSP